MAARYRLDPHLILCNTPIHCPNLEDENMKTGKDLSQAIINWLKGTMSNETKQIPG